MKRLLAILLALAANLQGQAPYESLLLLAPAAAAGGGGSPAVESVGSTNSSNVSTLITNWVTAVGANRLLLIQISYGDDTKGALPDSVTVDGGANITNSVIYNTNDLNYTTVQMFHVLAPASGAHVIVCDVSTSISDFTMATIVMTNAHQSAPFGTAVAASGDGDTPSVTVSSSNLELVIGGCATDSAASLAVSGGTEIWKYQNVSSDTDHGGARYTGAASVNASWTHTSGPFAVAAVPVKAP